MIYREPGILAVVGFGSTPAPSHFSRQQVASLSQSSCVSPVQLTEGREDGGSGVEPNHTAARKLHMHILIIDYEQDIVKTF
jgi:hypothetical protein